MHFSPFRASIACTLLALATLAVAALALADDAADAEKLLQSAQDAYSKKDWPVATIKFRDVVSRYPKTPSEPAAKLGLAVCLIDGHDKNYAEAQKLLVSLKGDEKGVDGPQWVYYRAAAARGLAVQEIASSLTAPKDAGKHVDAAKQHFKQAAELFAKARDAYAARGAPAFAWTAVAICDLAEMHLRLGDYKAAIEETKVVFKDLPWKLRKERALAIYYNGFAHFMLNDRAAAEKSLSMLAPFTDVRFGTHARYLLARCFHLADERTEAALHYEGVLNDYTREKKEAKVALTKLTEMARDPVEKHRAETLVRDNPTPDHVIRAFFYSAVLLMEAGRFSEAKQRLQVFSKAPPGYPLTFEAKLRLGICQVQLKEGPAALATLESLAGADAALEDQILLWTARAASLVVPPAAQKAAQDKAVARVIDFFTKAAAAAEQRASADAGAKERRGEILLELVDLLLQFNRGADAVHWCQELKSKQALPDRGEELAQRSLAALHLAGEYDKSDAECRLFLQKYPDSQFKPEVLFRFAENAYFRSVAAENQAQGEDKGLKALRDEALKRYQVLLDDYPDHPRASNARFNVGMLYLKLGDGKNAAVFFEQIPPTERTGERAIASLLLADLKLAEIPPGVPEDALAAGRMEVELKKAADMFESYVAAEPNGPRTAEALIRVGQTLQRLASLQTHPQDRNKLYQDARAAFDRVLLPQFNNNPLQALALVERARCRALYGGDVNKSITELRQFANEPLRSRPAAPLAIMQAAAWLRAQNKNPDALTLVAKFADEYGKRPNADAGMRGLLAYHHGLALQEAGKFSDARAALSEALKLIPDKTEAADAAVRWALCKKGEAAPIQESIKKLLLNPIAANKEKAKKLSEDVDKLLAEAATFLDAEADKLKDKRSAADARARMLYEAAWLYRAVADTEITAARALKIAEAEKALGDKLRKLPPVEISLTQLPPRPAEAKVRARYRALIDAYGDTPLSLEARLELAEYLAERDEYGAAIKVLVDALDREPTPEMTDKVRLLLGTCHAAKGNHKQALAQFEILGQNLKSKLAPEAKLRAGEVYMEQKNYAEAVKRFAVFRDVVQFQQIAGVTDRGLLRLGHALAAQKQWDAARQAHETLINRHGATSKWAPQAFYGIGHAREQQNQHEQAMQSYIQATTGPISETAAMAQIRIGVCRMTLKRYRDAADAFLVVPNRFGFDQWNAVALLEASEAFAQLKDVDQQAQTLNRVIREYADTPWAKDAQERLSKLQKG
jgi:TolA-binding protein